MTIKVGNQYIHIVLGYVDDAGTTVITEDPELATMTGKYSDTSAAESTDPAAYTWEEIDITESGNDEEEEENGGDDTTDLLFRLADTQKTESIQENMVTGTNQGAEGWKAEKGTIEAAACSPEENGATVNGVRWVSTSNDNLSRTEDLTGDAVPDHVTVSFWWNASAQCGLTASIGDNVSEKQSNYDSDRLDEDGNIFDMSGVWLFFEALVPISTTADSYPVKITTDSAVTVDICNFKVEPGDKATRWTTSSKEAMDAANAEAINRKTIIREYNGGVLVAKTGQTIGALVNANGSFDVVGVSWDGETPSVTSTLYARYGAETTILNGNGDYIKLSDGSVEVSGTIKGATLEGAQLTGEAIDIRAVNEKYASSVNVYTEFDDSESGDRPYYLHMRVQHGTSLAAIDIAPGGVTIRGTSLNINVDELTMPYSTNKYTIPTNGAVSAGTVTVQRMGNLCHVYGQITLTGKLTEWTTILSDLPAIAGSTQNLYISVNGGWGNASAIPAVLRLSPDGVLDMQYGQATAFNFSFTYICE